MKIKSIFVVLLTAFVCCLFATGCNDVEKFVIGVEQTENGVKVLYSDGTFEEIDIQGQVGAQGPAGEQGPEGVQGPTGAQGPAGEDAKGIEFRYYRAKLWWKYEGTNVWYPLVSTEELEAEALSLDNGDFALSVYAEEYDLSLDITTFVKVNGNYTEATTAGNTLTFEKVINEETVYFDITKNNEEVTMISYKEEGIDETEVEFVENESLADFVGSYTLVSGEEEIVISISDYGIPNVKTSTGTIYMSGYVKGDTFVGVQNSTGEYFNLTLPALGAEFATAFKDGEGTLVEKSDWEVSVWAPVEELLGVYTMYVDDTEVFDFALKAYNQLNLYDDTYPQYTYNIDTASFTVNDVTYSVKKNANGDLVATTSEAGKVATLVKYDDVISKLSTFTTVEGAEEAINWTINEWGGVNKNGEFYSNSYQKKNTVVLKPWGSNEYYTITFDTEELAFVGARVVDNGGNLTENPITVVTDAKVEDFLGAYTISYVYYGNLINTSFEIGPNPYAEGYAFIIAGNPNPFTLSERTITYINNRGGMGYMVTANLDGTKSVVYFFIDDNGNPDPSTYIECTVEFTPSN